MKPEHIKTHGFKSSGEFFSKVRRACLNIGDPDPRLVRVGQKEAGHMKEGDDAQGGFLVPEMWADGIYEAAALEGQIVRPRAKVFNMTSDSLKIRTLVDTDRSSNIYGGVTFNWTEEAGVKSAYTLISKPAVGALELTPHKLVAGCFASNELENDYGQFGEFMSASFGKALSFIEDDAFFWGTGAGMPLGVMSSGAIKTVTRANNDQVNWVDLANMAKMLLPDSWSRAIFLLNPDVLDELLEVTAPAINQVAGIDFGNRTFFGIPIIPTEHSAATDNTGDVMLFDFGHYVIGDRSLEISASREADFGLDISGFKTGGFSFDSTFWRVVLRTDGQPTLAAPITPLRGANTLSPFVVLTTDS